MMSKSFNEFLMVFGAIQIANADLVCDVPGLCQVSNLTKLYLHKRKLEIQSNAQIRPEMLNNFSIFAS